MSNKIVLKKSSVTNKVPLISDLQYGEVALNYADGKLYFKDSSNTIQHFFANPTLDYVTDIGNTTANHITVGSLSIGTEYTLPTIDGAPGQIISTDGNGNVIWTDQAGISAGWASINLNLTDNTPLQVIDSVQAIHYSTIKYVAQIKTNTGIQSSEILVASYNDIAYISEFGIIQSGDSLGSFSTDIVSGMIRLLFTPVNNNTELKLKKVTLES